MSKGPRSVELSLEIEAPPERVWRALSEAQQILRWFAPEARVNPGVGGSVWMSWGGGWEGESRIEIWDPPRRLRTVSETPPYDADGKPVASAAPLPIAVDYVLEGGGGVTRLRLTHSGFGPGAERDDEVDGVARGWAFELRSLRHYLTRHFGRERRFAWVRATSPLPATEAWHVLAQRYLLGFSAAGLREGEPYALRTSAGDAITGRVQVVLPQGFAGTADGFGDGLYRVWVDSAGGQRMIQVWLSAWDAPAAAVDAFRDRTSATMGELFP
jgi:uncharacterized protein YndB with AHSA1/START domain